MRAFAIGAVLALALPAGAAIAGPAQVQVSIGSELADKADDYGVEDLARLAERLDREVEESLAASGRFPDAQVRLVIEDATPNRPTFQQLRDRPGLSMESYGIGGAEISGEIVTADGLRQPLSYRWFETNIRNAGLTTWSDANRAFGRFANRLADGRF